MAFAANQMYGVTRNQFYDGDINMDTKERNEELANKLESYLNQACEAEAARDFEEAENTFLL